MRLIMKKPSKNMSISKAILKWREKHPSLVKLTVMGWIKSGKVNAIQEKHGFLMHWKFSPVEVERVYRLLKTDWKQGKAALPGAKK